MVVMLGCEKAFRKDALFPNSALIIVPEYDYEVDSKSYHSDGSAASVLSPDTFPSTPALFWEPTSSKLVAAAILDSRIEVNSQGIINQNNIVWMWHTGLNTGQEGSLSYSEGRSVKDGILLSKDKLQPLISGQGYTWVVWAWDKTGTKVEESSAELGFIVE